MTRDPAAAGGEMRALTGLRGCAALTVMTYHFALALPAAEVPLRPLLAHGYLCVDLFFVLSGFVLAHAHGRDFAGPHRLRAHARFLAARLARVYPLYLLVVGGTAGLRLWRGDAPAPAALGFNLLMVQGWGLADSLEGATWSVSTEWAVYLVFPLLVAACLGSSRRGAWTAGLLAGLGVAGLAALPDTLGWPGQGRSGPLDLYSAATPAPLLRCVAEFSLGLLTFRVAQRAGRRIAQGAGGRVARGAAVLSCLAAATVAGLMACYGADVAVVALFCVLVGSLSYGRGPAARALGGRVPHRIGRWSYSIYLLHDKFGHLALALRGRLEGGPVGSVVVIGVTGAAVVGCSALCFAWVEQPLRRLALAWAGSVGPVEAARPLPAAAASPRPDPARAESVA